MANARNRSLEVTIISGEDLRINGRPIKNNAFVTVKAESRCSPSSHESTKPDARGDSYPYWDEKLHVELPAGSPYVVVEAHRRSSSAGDKLVGMAWIPVSDFVGDYTPENHLHFLSYRLRDAKGLRNGIINISVRVVTSSHKGASSCSSPLPPPVLESRMPVDREKHGGTVTGVPVWFPNQWKS
ncbi:BON1-associated protein 1-like [Rhodamnia argentea]|uniref:BON1-associated protein 1-like n=1 Tax=Rhodamnia argentea TaxID=178133 RepID=A0A8B8PFA9_9MYRT|nr:BON1-associated protein 1-like [Rhodamnia argentea]